MAQPEDLPANPAPAPELAKGTVVAGYVIESKLGEGGMSVVYGALQPRIGKRVAIKVLSRTFDDPSAVARFEQEARLVNAIRHANIVDVFQFGELPDGRSFFVMECLDGESLGARLKRGPLPVREAVEILDAICDALEAAHEQGVVHRDLKADNVFLVATRRQRQVKLLDFGLAKLTHGEGATSILNTSNGVLVGTPAYMSPEQARAKEVDARTDIYALGCLTFKMLTGKLPFIADNPMDLLVMHLNAPPPSAAKLADVPRALSDLVKQMMAKSAAARPSLAEIRTLLADVRDGKVTKTPPSAKTPASEPKRGRSLFFVLGPIVLASGAAIAIAVVTMLDRKPAPATQAVGQGSGSAVAVAPSGEPSTAGSATIPTTAEAPAVPEVDSDLIEIEPNATPGKSRRPRGSGAPTIAATGSAAAAAGSGSAAATDPNDDGIRPGALVLTLDTPSEIAIDGTVRATGIGGKFDLRPGKYRLRVTAPRRQPVEREIEIKTAETTIMQISAGAAPETAPPAASVDAGVADEPN